MKVEQIAVALYEALQDKKYTAVEIQTVKTIDGEVEKYYININHKRHPISKKIALNAIKWGVQIDRLPKKYKIGNVTFTI